MKGCYVLFLAMLAVKSIKMETLMETDMENGENNYDLDAEYTENEEDVVESNEPAMLEEDDEDEDNKARHFKEIQLYTTDERCAEIGVCSGFDYGEKDVVVSFEQKPEIRFTSDTTYRVKDNKDYLTLTFINSKFANFPLRLFYAFQVEELDMRNCSIEKIKWDNFLRGDKLTILLLSENLITTINPMLFSNVENLSFLFLDSNRIETLYNDSFKGIEKLNFLDLHDNLIEILPSEVFSHLPSLQQLNLAGNRLTVIKYNLFSECPHLFSIHLQRNSLSEIQDYAFQNQNNIKYLDISNNPELEVLVVSNIKVENLWIKNCSLYRVNIYGQAVHVDLQQNRITELYFNHPEYLETLRLKDNSLEQISSLALAKNLRTLDVSNNPQLKTLPDLMQINSLERLDLSNITLKEIPITVMASPNSLRSLNVSSNQLQEIDPMNFKYFEGLSQFYIHNNNWNCYNLQILMEMVLKPLKISYTHDEFDDNFPGEYMQGIKCMYRLEEPDEYYADNSQQMENSAQYDYSALKDDSRTLSDSNENDNSAALTTLQYNQLKFDNAKEVEKLRREFKAIIGIYEQKFAAVLNKLNSIDSRLKEFEQFNQTMWQQVSILV